VKSGPDLPAPRLAPLSAAHVLARGASVIFLALIGLPGIEQVACSPACRTCFASLPEAVSHALPGTLPILFLVLAATLALAVVHLWNRRPALMQHG
jgi:hypothetical protein